jgi:hypothetical protein
LTGDYIANILSTKYPKLIKLSNQTEKAKAMRSRTLNFTYENVGSGVKILDVDISHLKYPTIELDAKERDLTINSLYYNIRTGIIAKNSQVVFLLILVK